MKIRAKMYPHVSELRGESGINRVVEAYFKYLPQFDVELVKPDAKSTDYDLTVSHAGNTGANCDVSHLHGVYFTNDYPGMNQWAYHTNARIVEAIRHAKQITVPSHWVAEVLQRDVRINPHVVPHGIEVSEWLHNEQCEGYVLYNKNRVGVDVCDNSIMIPLADAFEDVQFLSTYPTLIGKRNNLHALIPGLKGNKKQVPHKEMKKYVQRSAVYLSITKETFGLGILEAMASGIPVLGWNYGGNSFLVKHGICGYLAKPNDFDDLCEGLAYCFKHRKILGQNGIEVAKEWPWEPAIEQVASIYRMALESNNRPMFIDESIYKV